MNDVVIYAPCRTFQVRVSSGSGTSLSPLEQHVLRAVDAGIDTVPLLCDLLGLTSRLMVDLLGDLWRVGHVSFDFFDERVQVSERVHQLVAADELGALPGAEVTDEQLPMMLDTLSGLLSPVGGLSRTPKPALQVPDHNDEAQLSGIDPADLMEAVSRALADNGQVAGGTTTPSRTRRVLRAYLNPASLTSPSAERHYRKVGVQVAIDSDGRLIARLAEESMSGRHEEIAQARLVRLIEDQPAGAFVRALRAAAAGPPEEPETLASVLADLADQARSLATAAPEARAGKHAELAAGSRRTVRRLRALTQQEADVQLLTGHAEHRTAISRLIRSARTQLVLACPWIDYDGWSAYAGELEAATRRGVQIVLLRGIGHEDVSSDPAVENALNALRRAAAPLQGAGSRVLLSGRSSSIIHAKLVVCDDRELVVTSLNFLQPSQAGTREMGVRVAALPGRRSPTIGDAIAWARVTMPDFSVAQAVIADSASFGSPVTAAARTDPDPVPDSSDDPPLTVVQEDDEDSPAVRAWSAAWTSRVEGLSAAARRRRSSVRFVRDGEHRDLLWSALRTARRNVLITSDALSGDVVDQAFVDLIEQCLDRGADITLVYRRARRESDRKAVDRLEQVSRRNEPDCGRLQVRRENSHAKVLVVDDEAVVTSFNFLSFEGYYGGAGRRRQRSEVGIRVYGGGFARELLENFGLVEPAPTADEVPGSVPSDGALRAFTAAQRVLQSGPEVTGAELDELTGPVTVAYPVLAALRTCGAVDDLLELAVAAVLSRDDTSGADAAAWWEWLARRRFEVGDFGVAAALREVVPDARERPRQIMVELGALRGTPQLAVAVGDAALREDITPAEWCALLAVGAEELLRAGGTDLAGAVAIAGASAPAPWSELGRIALRWWDEAGRPLPMERIWRGAEARRKAATTQDLWAALAAALDVFERHSPPFAAGSGTRKFLLRAGGPLNLLMTAQRNQDRDAVRTWVEDPQLDDVGAWVDNATRSSGSTKLIHGHLRPPIVDRIAAIVAAARAVADQDDPTGPRTEAFDETIKLAEATVAAVQEMVPLLTDALAAVQGPERVLVRAAIHDLQQLVGGVE